MLKFVLVKLTKGFDEKSIFWQLRKWLLKWDRLFVERGCMSVHGVVRHVGLYIIWWAFYITSLHLKALREKEFIFLKWYLSLHITLLLHHMQFSVLWVQPWEAPILAFFLRSVLVEYDTFDYGSMWIYLVLSKCFLTCCKKSKQNVLSLSPTQIVITLSTNLPLLCSNLTFNYSLFFLFLIGCNTRGFF